MPQAFDITTTTPSVKLSGSGEVAREGELIFTVSNALRRTVRGRILVQAEGKADASWLTVSEPEVDFASDGTQQVTVKVKVPPGAPEGTYSYHLLVSSVNNPDEEYTTGPTVSFAVGPPGKKSFPWWIVLVAVGALVVIGGAVGLFLGLRGGTKATPPGANCTADADCPSDQRCVEVSAGSKSCLLRPNQPCQRDIDCSSFWCVGDKDKQVCSRDDGKCKDSSECRPPAFTCASGLCRSVDGQECNEDKDCASGFCENTCKPAPKCVPPCAPLHLCVRGQCKPIVIGPIFRFTPQKRLSITPR
jgi:hypothetical protein